MSKGIKTYIAGKITGEPDYKKKFSAVAEKLIEKGEYVMNPAILPEGFEYGHYMNICIEMLRGCDRVVFLQNWIDSKGARTEYLYATLWEKEIIYCGEGEPI